MLREPQDPTNLSQVALYNVHLANAMNQVTSLSALETPSLSGLRAASALETAKVLTKLLSTTNSRFNFAEHKKLNEVQIGFLVGSILTNYWRWKIDEVVLVLREGIAGKLKSFDHIDEAVVLGWFREYESVREALIETAAYNQTIAHKETGKQRIEQMGPVYVKQYCATMEPHELPEYEEGLRVKFADRPELAQAVAEYQHEQDQRVQAETRRLEAAREKARILLGQINAQDYPPAALELTAAQHFAAERGLPKVGETLTAAMQVVREESAA